MSYIQYEQGHHHNKLYMVHYSCKQKCMNTEWNITTSWIMACHVS